MTRGIEDIRGRFEEADTLPPFDETPPDQGPDDRPPPGGGDDGPPPEDDAPRLPEAEGAAYPLNDYGNGQRLLLYFGGDMLFVPRLGWYRWQGDRWLADEDELTVRKDAQRVAAKIIAEIDHLALEPWERVAIDLGRVLSPELRELDKARPADLTDEQATRKRELREIMSRADAIKERFDKRKGRHRTHAQNSGNTSKISNMLQEAKTEVHCSINDLNADPLMVNVANGTLRFFLDIDPHDAEWGDAGPKWQVELRDHDRGDRISKLMPVTYEANAPCPHWLRFLDRVQPDAAMREFLQRWVGYCLTGKTTEQKLVFNFGSGRNGKSTFVDTLARVFADYGTTVPIETLTGSEQRKGSDATPDLVRLPGARFVRASEPEQGTRMKEAMIKALTGGEAIMIRRMMQEFVEIEPEFKLMISGNHKPEIRGSDDGIWRRVLLVPWEEQIEEHEVDPTLPEKLWAEAPGILSWAVEGFLKWATDGLCIPEEVKAATEEYRQESDKLRLFLQTECEITGSPEDWESSRDLRDSFNAWMLNRDGDAWGSRAFSNALKDRAGVVKGPDGQRFTSKKRSDAGYSGIRIKQEAKDLMAKYGEELRAVAARKG